MIVNEQPLESADPLILEMGIGLGAAFVQVGPPGKINKLAKMDRYSMIN